jgi:hypothetical protein
LIHSKIIIERLKPFVLLFNKLGKHSLPLLHEVLRPPLLHHPSSVHDEQGVVESERFVGESVLHGHDGAAVAEEVAVEKSLREDVERLLDLAETAVDEEDLGAVEDGLADLEHAFLGAVEVAALELDLELEEVELEMVVGRVQHFLRNADMDKRNNIAIKCDIRVRVKPLLL